MLTAHSENLRKSGNCRVLREKSAMTCAVFFTKSSSLIFRFVKWSEG